MPAFPRALFCFASLIVLAMASPAFAQSSSNGIAAVVNGRVITKSEVRDAVTAQEQMLAMQLHDDPTALQRELANLRATALDSLIDRELILAEFKRMGATIKSQWVDDDINGIIRDSFKGNRDEFVKELAKTGMTLKKFRELREKMMIVQAMRAKQAAEQGPATPREVDEFYNKNVSKWRQGDMIKIRTITIPKFSGEANTTPETQRKLADEIRAKLAKGADFAATAKTYSQDSYAEDGGARDWMARDQMPPSMANVAFNLKTGGLSSVISDEAAYVIIACDAVKYGDSPPVSKMRPEIERAISSEKSKAVVDKWMEGLRKKATIKKFGS
ncbi:MAG: SurA N-terminal domain-containing protein [Prosthecobacter sp.]|nr:SurA N-terminal domain-containing protein [Prosthecobacter sp.]